MTDEIWVDVKVANPRNLKKQFAIRALVDTGSFDSAMPRPLLKKIGVEPRGRETYKAWAGKTHRRPWGEADFSIQGMFGTCRVTFEPKGETPTIGAVTLDVLGLNIDMINEKLRPARVRMGRGPRRRIKTPLRRP